MNKNKKIIGLLTLLTFTISLTTPLAAMENENKNAPQKPSALELLRKKQEENKKKFGGGDDKNESKIEKQEDQGEICAICRGNLNKHPSIILHTAEGATKNMYIDHCYHVHCLWNWLQANNKGTPAVTDLTSNLNSKKRIKMGCPLCGNEEFNVELGELCTKYSIYLGTLTPVEKIENLEHLPATDALTFLKELAAANPENLDSYGDKRERNLKIQKTVCRMPIIDNDTKAEAINAALKIIGEDPVCKEFFIELCLCRDLLQEDFVAYFKKAFDCDDYCVLPLEEQFSGYNPVIDADKINVNNRNDVLKYKSIDKLYWLFQKKLPQDLQIEYYKKVLNAYTPSSAQKKDFINRTFKLLSWQAKTSVFDETYKLLNNHEKSKLLMHLKEQLIADRGKTTVADMVFKASQNVDPEIAAQLLEKFWDELEPQDRFDIFLRIFDDRFIGLDDIWILSVKMLAQRLEETEFPLYFQKVALFLLARDDNGTLRQNMLCSLLDSRVHNGLYTFSHLYDLLLTNYSFANKDLFSWICSIELTLQSRSTEEFINIIRITLKHITSPQFKTELLRRSFKKLPKNYHTTIVLNYLHASEEDKELTELICALVHRQSVNEKLTGVTNFWPKLPENRRLDGLKTLGIFFNLFPDLTNFIKIKEWLPQHTIGEKWDLFTTLHAQQPGNNKFNYEMILGCCKNEEEKKEFCSKANSLLFATNSLGITTNPPKKDAKSCGIDTFNK